jgi:hypothetical protein
LPVVAVEAEDFARVLGKSPRFDSVSMEILESLAAVTEVFGPPERKGAVAYWNFVSRDSSKATIFCKVRGKWRDLTFSLSTSANAGPFHEWMLDRLANVNNGVSPMFLDAANYEIRRIA